jgi:UDP-glucose 4-epimerase
MKTLLITNLSSDLGQRIARLLSARAAVRVIGTAARGSIPQNESWEVFSPPQTRHQLVELLRSEQVDTLLHLDVLGEEQPAQHGETTFLHNVQGSAELLGACAAAKVRRVVLRSSSMVYGAHVRNPAFIEETRALSTRRQFGLLREYIALDRFASEFAATHPAVEVLCLRCAALVGDGISSPLARYLAQPAPRMLLGFDPRMQIMHPDDAAAAFTLATTSSATGALHIAADDPLTLKHLLRLAGKQPVQIPTVLLDGAVRLGMQRTLLGAWPWHRDFLRFGCVVDTRRARAKLAWQPLYTAHTILRDLQHTKVIPVYA